MTRRSASFGDKTSRDGHTSSSAGRTRMFGRSNFRHLLRAHLCLATAAEAAGAPGLDLTPQFFLLHFRHLCASAQSRFVAEGESARLAGRKAVRLDQAFPVRTKPPAATDATRGQTPWPLSFQDHLVLETNPRFRLILYWITLPLALRRSSCYDELTTSLAAVSRPAAHNRTPSRIAPFLFVSACHCCIGSNDRGARVCVSCIRRRNSFCGVSTSFRYALWVVASRLRNRNVRLRASCEWPPSRPTREFIAVAAFGRQLRESDALRSPTPRQSSNLGIRFLVDAFARPQHLVAT